MSFLRRSCLIVILVKDPQPAIYVAVKSEGNHDLSRKSSECKIYVVLNRNIKRKLLPLIDYIEHNLYDDG